MKRKLLVIMLAISLSLAPALAEGLPAFRSAAPVSQIQASLDAGNTILRAAYTVGGQEAVLAYETRDPEEIGTLWDAINYMQISGIADEWEEDGESILILYLSDKSSYVFQFNGRRLFSGKVLYQLSGDEGFWFLTEWLTEKFDPSTVSQETAEEEISQAKEAESREAFQVSYGDTEAQESQSGGQATGEAPEEAPQTKAGEDNAE